MAGTAASAANGGKRKRAAAFSEHEKYMHKSGVVLQREGKKIRAFLVRKAVAQLKQSREQHEQATKALAAVGDTEEENKKRKRAEGKAKKLFHHLEKLETEHAALKTLDLKAIVARAFEKTGLTKDEVVESEDEDDEVEKHDKHAAEMYRYGRGRVVVEEDPQVQADDDGFNSEDYDEAPRSDVSDSEGESDEERDGDAEEKRGAEDGEEAGDALGEDEQTVYGPQGPPGETAEEAQPENTTDPALVEQLVDRVLAHNQMQPFLDAIHQYVAKKEKEDAKKRRQKEKNALKRARASLIGGRSNSAPTSMFFGSLSGGAADDDDDMVTGFGRASMAGAEDDIAEFLGETKKKKNRAGQQARRQKAIRLEEQRRLEEDGGDGFQKRRFHDRNDPRSVSKYGPSERPKKQQKKEPTRGKPRDNDRPQRPSSWQDKSSGARGGHDVAKPTPDEKRHERRERSEAPRAAPARKPPAPPQRKAEAEPSHPSWIAKQALKEKMKVDITAFSGKKITFGDD